MEAEKDHVVSGQQVLPGLIEVMQVEAQALDKPQNEAFCWEYVTNGGRAADAYSTCINGSVSKLRAQKNASWLLGQPEIIDRVAEISKIIQRKYEQQVLAYRVKSLSIDRRELVDEFGKLKAFNELTDEQAAIVDIEMRYVDGALRTIPLIATRDKAADALQKMFGMDKNKMELTGKDGAALPVSSAVTIYIPSNDRD